MSIKRKHSFLDPVDNYFGDLEKEFERWREAIIEKPSWNKKDSTIEPLHNTKVTPTEVVVTVDLPLTEERAVQVKPLDERTLEISAKMKRKIRLEELGITYHKAEFHKLYCHARVPVPVNMSRMKIKFKKGMLEIRIPRKNKD